MLLRRMADEALQGNRATASADYCAQAGQTQRSAEVLRQLITRQDEEA